MAGAVFSAPAEMQIGRALARFRSRAASRYNARHVESGLPKYLVQGFSGRADTGEIREVSFLCSLPREKPGIHASGNSCLGLDGVARLRAGFEIGSAGRGEYRGVVPGLCA